jgi:glycerol-3-phosphate dehydrogenase
MTQPTLDARDRASHLRALEQEKFDLIVIGGGITGAGIARDAALRGLSVALIEAADFACGTSSRSSKMIHGGLRYLAQGDTDLVKEAASERQTLRRIAPHLARLQPFLIPTPTVASIAKLRAGLWLFEKLGKVPKAERHQIWSPEEVAEREPSLRGETFAGAAVYPEFLTDDARLTLANVRSAVAAGAVAVSHARVAAVRGHSPDHEVTCRSTLTDEAAEVRVRGRVVVNAAGPWADLVRSLEDADAPPQLTLTKGVHVVVPHALVPVARTVILRTADKRGAFAVPRGDITYIGTTDTFYPRPDAWPTITEDDVRYLFEAAESGLHIGRLRLDDVTAVWSGVRPLIAQAGRKPSEISRRDELWTGPLGVITVAGGKLSAYRAMAERVVDLVVARVGRTAKACTTAKAALPGGDFVAERLRQDAEIAATGPLADRLIELYGAEAVEVARDGGDAAAEARRAVTHEGALTLEDYWVRRSMRSYFQRDAGLSALAPAAAAMSALLGWSPERQAAEIAVCRNIHADSLGFAARQSKVS